MSLVNYTKIQSNSVLQHLFLEGTQPAQIIVYGEPVNDTPQCHIYYQIETVDGSNRFSIYDVKSSEKQDNRQMDTNSFANECTTEEDFIQTCIQKFEQFFYGDIKEEDATQSSAFSGRVSLFGDNDNNSFSYSDWYNQLFELNDFDEE